MNVTINDFEDYPELTGDLSDEKYDWWSNSELLEVYYKKVYKDIYDDEIINYGHNKYMNVVINILHSMDENKYMHIINRIQDILLFKKTYHTPISNKLEEELIHMIDISEHGTKSLIYEKQDGSRYILCCAELERQSNWPIEVCEHSFAVLFGEVRTLLRSQYVYNRMIMDELYNELIETNGTILKVELATRNTKTNSNIIRIGVYVMLEVYKLKQITAIRQMSIIDKQMKRLNYCWTVISNEGKKIRQWFPPYNMRNLKTKQLLG